MRNKILHFFSPKILVINLNNLKFFYAFLNKSSTITNIANPFHVRIPTLTPLPPPPPPPPSTKTKK